MPRSIVQARLPRDPHAREWWRKLSDIKRRRVREWLRFNPPPPDWQDTNVAYAYTEMPAREWLGIGRPSAHEHLQSVGLDTQYERLLALLRELSFEERDVVLASGKRSNFYIDCKQVSLHAEGQFLFGQLARSIIDKVAPAALGVGGLTLGADPLASAVSLTSFVAGRPLHAFIVRKEPKGHGTGQWLEGTGNLPTSAQVVVLEDVVTTGGSTIKAIDRVREAGFEVACVVALVDREEGGREAVESHAPMYALYRRGDFL